MEGGSDRPGRCAKGVDLCKAAGGSPALTAREDRTIVMALRPLASIGPVLLGFACSLLLLGAAPAPPRPHIGMDDPSWRLDSSSNGITLYQGSVPGVGIVPLKAVMTIPGTIEEVALVLEDIPRRREWISNFGRSVLLERANGYDQTEYLAVDVPWPVQDRSALLRARVTVSDDLRRATIAAESVNSHPADTLPPLVRSKVYASTFQMTQVGKRVEVVALIFVDPRGSIPKWVVNYFARRGARVTLSGLRRQVARKLYSPSQLGAMRQRMRAFRAFREQRVLVTPTPTKTTRGQRAPASW